ncbi:hypothetical protein ACLB2K_068940 [Fragaria x ananassa]
MARFWTKFRDDKKPNLYGFFQRAGEGQIKAVKEAQECLKILEEHFPEEKFFDGDKIGMTDLSLGWLAFWFEGMEEEAGVQVLEAASFPRLHAWIRNFKEVQVIKEKHPDQTRLQGFKETMAQLFFDKRLRRQQQYVVHVHVKRHDGALVTWCEDVLEAKHALLEQHRAEQTFSSQAHKC